ncbi:MAG: caspase family protein [Chitinophagaceae bacterium]
MIYAISMRYKLFLAVLGCLFYGLAYGTEPPGYKIVYLDRTFPLSSKNYIFFVRGFKPDSAVLVFKQPKQITFRDTLGGIKETSTRSYFIRDDHFILTPGTFYILRKNPMSKFPDLPDSVKSRKQWEEYNADTALNRRIIAKTVESGDAAFFRCYYKNASGSIYKYQDISGKGKLIKECLLTDAVNLSLEIQKFYESGVTSSRTQYLVGLRDSLERTKFDSAWFDLNPKLVKSGREDIYYINQNIRLSRFFANNILKDTTYKEFYSTGQIKIIYTIKKGVLDGRSQTFGKDGVLQRELVYEKGKVIDTLLNKTGFDNYKKAFLVGIDKFDRPAGIPRKGTFDWMSLAGCVNDVRLLSATLQNAKRFNPSNIYQVTDDGATKEKMLKAFATFSADLKKGDVVFIHFSGHGTLTGKLPDNLKNYEGLAIPCRDANYGGDTTFAGGSYIFQFELENFLNSAKKQVGRTGQVIVSLDVSHSGELLSYGEKDTVSTTGTNNISMRGESNTMLFKLVQDETAPVVIYTGTNQNEFGQEMQDEINMVYGAYSLALAKSFANPSILNTTELHEDVTSFLKRNGKKQNPGYLASETQFLFEESELTGSAQMAVLPVLKQSGNSFMLSVGISEYPDKSNKALSFKNCETDARAYASFFEKQFEEIADGKNRKKLFSSLLINKDATKEKILIAINNAISNTKPEDYFIFNFSGYCKPLRDTSGKQVTYFVPYGLDRLNDSAEITKKGIPLSELKDLFQMIPANNQLFITEAGSTDDFQKEFIQALIETSPSIASLSNKNRIFIVPKGSGLDKFSCNNIGKEHGPINYFVTNLADELNIFGLFEGGVYTEAVKFSLNKTEMDCDYFRTEYFDIFFEREFISSLKYLLPDDVMKSRGLKVREKDKAAVANAISKRYALVVGTNVYTGKPDWQDLEGVPDLDAKDIARELEKNYGFDVTTLIDKPADSIYENILRLSRILQPNDQLLIYVAGHGDYDEKLFDDGFIVCASSKPAKDDPYRNTYIQYSKLSRMINKLPARQILMVLDVCFGGTFDERVARNRARSKTTVYDDLTSENYMAEKLKIKTRLYLTSGGKKEVPNGYKGSHSPFAQKLLLCLQTKGGAGKILTSADFYEYVKKLPSGPLLGSFGDDEPGSEFIILAK